MLTKTTSQRSNIAGSGSVCLLERHAIAGCVDRAGLADDPAVGRVDEGHSLELSVDHGVEAGERLPGVFRGDDPPSSPTAHAVYVSALRVWPTVRRASSSSG